MTLFQLLKTARQIWKHQRNSLEEMIPVYAVVLGDIARILRRAQERITVVPFGVFGKPGYREVIMPHRFDKDHWELQKEMGNLILTTIRFADDLGFSPEECVGLAIKAQDEYKKGSQ